MRWIAQKLARFGPTHQRAFGIRALENPRTSSEAKKLGESPSGLNRRDSVVFQLVLNDPCADIKLLCQSPYRFVRGRIVHETAQKICWRKQFRSESARRALIPIKASGNKSGCDAGVDVGNKEECSSKAVLVGFGSTWPLHNSGITLSVAADQGVQTRGVC